MLSSKKSSKCVQFSQMYQIIQGWEMCYFQRDVLLVWLERKVNMAGTSKSASLTYQQIGKGESLPQFSNISVTETNKTQHLKTPRRLLFSILNRVWQLMYQGEKKGKILQDKNIHGQIIQLLGLLKHLWEIGPNKIYLHSYCPSIFLRHVYLRIYKIF